MVFYERFTSYDYKEKIGDNCTLPMGTTYGTIDSCYFNDTTGIISINSSGNSHGRINATFYEMTPGDTIEIAFDYRKIAGEDIKVGFGEVNASGNFYVHEYQPINTGEWETVVYKYNFRNLNDSRKFHFYVGLVRSQVGHFDIRHLRVNIKTKRKFEKILDTKVYEIRKVNGVFEIRNDFTESGASIVVNDDSTLKLVFNDPFRSRPVATCGADYAANGNQYRPLIGDLLTTSVNIKFCNNEGTLLSLSEIPDTYHLGVHVIGWKKL